MQGCLEGVLFESSSVLTSWAVRPRLVWTLTQATTVPDIIVCGVLVPLAVPASVRPAVGHTPENTWSVYYGFLFVSSSPLALLMVGYAQSVAQPRLPSCDEGNALLSVPSGVRWCVLSVFCRLLLTEGGQGAGACVRLLFSWLVNYRLPASQRSLVSSATDTLRSWEMIAILFGEHGLSCGPFSENR